jgi:hypothetical protein
VSLALCFDDETVAAFAEGRAAARSREELEAHLDACEDCRELLDLVVANLPERGPNDAPTAELGPPVDLFDEPTSDAANTLPAAARFGDRFAIEGIVGRGGMGTVFRARDTDGSLVALKLMRGEAADPKRVAREIEVLASLEHPAIVRYVAHGPTSQGGVFLVMEWLDGLSLDERLSAGRLSIDETITLGLRVADGLAEVHRRGIVHRDIKPSNLVLVGGLVEELKLVDFGIARKVDARTRLTMSGSLLGTPGYMAPEQARGETQVGAAADIFALGAVLYCALTGRPPFVGHDVLAILLATVIEPPISPRDFRAEMPAALEDLVLTMLAKRPEERPADLDEVRRALRRIRDVEHEAVRDRPLDPSPPRLRVAQLTERERRFLSVVLVRPTDDLPLAQDGLREIAERHGGALASLLDGSLFVALADVGSPLDQAVRAARCALAIKAALPAAAVALATGRGGLDDQATPAALRVVRLPRDERTVRVDAVTAGLLASRFEVIEGDGLFSLAAERPLDPVDERHRMLLGRPSPCVGRERELSALEAIYDECKGEVDREPCARKVLVVGEAGIGKSRLRRELLRRLRDRGEPLEIWIGRGDPVGVGAPFALLLGALAKAVGLLPTDPPELKRERLRARVARHASRLEGDEGVTRVTAFLAEALGLPFGDDALPSLRGARRDAKVMADQIGRAWFDLISAECAEHPLVFVLEDLHWGDRASVQLLAAVVRAIEHAPLLVLALARPEARATFPELTTPKGAEELTLRPLARKASVDVARAVLGEAPTDTEIDRIVELSQGNPFFLEELIRASAEGHREAPETVLAMIEARLARLDASARRLLRAASIFGGVFWAGALAALVGERTAGGAIERSLAALAEAELITKRPTSEVAGETEYRFRHALVRETAYATLTDDDRRDGHASAGVWLAAHNAADARALAEHFDRGGAPRLAADRYDRAAAQALEANDAELARDLSDRAIASSSAAGDTSSARFGERLLVAAEARLWLADHAGCEALATRALGLVDAGAPAFFVGQRLVAHASGALGHTAIFAQASRALEATEARSTEALEERVKAIHTVIARLWFNGDFASYERLARLAEDVSPPSPSLLARNHRERARAAFRAGDLGDYTDHNRRGANLATAAGDLRYAAMLTVNVANGYIALGLPDRAEPILRELLSRSTFALDYLVIAAKGNLAQALSRLGRFDEAKAIASTAVEASAASGDRRFEGGMRTYFAFALAGLGALDEAEAQARLAVEHLATAPPLRPWAQATLAQILLAAGRVEEAKRTAGVALAAIDELGWVEDGEALVRLVDVEAKGASGDHEAAARALAIAARRVRERAAKIVDATYQTSFLERVQENARTLALAAAFGLVDG